MSRRSFKRPCHAIVAKALALLDSKFLARSQCYFGGGTRIVLALGEYRESEDIDLLCSSRTGYRALRSTITSHSLGKIAAPEVKLAREVLADRYGIRTFLDVDDSKIKFEIVYEGRIDLDGRIDESLSAPVLDERSCFAEKFLANADRWADESVLSRDVIDLAFMAESWNPGIAAEGYALAREAYGDTAADCARRAAKKLIEDKRYRKRCVDALRVNDTAKLAAGLKKIAAGKWIPKPCSKRA